MNKNEELLKFCKDYLECWTDAVINRGGANEWSDSGKWTDFHEEYIVIPLANRLNAQAMLGEMNDSNQPEILEKEYYRIDFILYRYIDKARHFWTLDYAIEHENVKFNINDNKINSLGWFDEFCKLIPIKCTKARVIIGYDSFDGGLKTRLGKCLEMLNAHERYNDITDTPILLILFPNTEYIKKYADSGYPNGMVHIFLFTKYNGTWTREDILTKSCEWKSEEKPVIDAELKNRLLISFSMIKDKNGSLPNQNAGNIITKEI